MEQQYVLENAEAFNLKDVFECGQCFRWNIEKDGSYTGVFLNNVLNAKQIDNMIIFTGICTGDIKTICQEYFDLNTDYIKIKSTLSKIDSNVEESIKYGEGIRILNQDLWEIIISFIISANNNIPRIKGIIERLSKTYGTEISFKENKYYTFPAPEQLSKASIEDLRNLGLGFRDKRIYQTTKIIHNDIEVLSRLQNEKNVDILKEQLLQLPGVGPKVADCIMLFSLKKFEVFPIDVWVKRVMGELYFTNESPSNKEIDRFAKEKFGNLAGLAQQYLFYSRRNA